jgi:hypothetical protein
MCTSFVRSEWGVGIEWPGSARIRLITFHIFGPRKNFVHDCGSLTLIVILGTRIDYWFGGSLAATGDTARTRGATASLPFSACRNIFATGRISTRSRHIGLRLELEHHHFGTTRILFSAGYRWDMSRATQTPARGPMIRFGFVFAERGCRFRCTLVSRGGNWTQLNKFRHCFQGIIGRLRRVGGYSGGVAVTTTAAPTSASASLPAIGLAFTLPWFIAVGLRLLIGRGGRNLEFAWGRRKPFSRWHVERL